MAHDHVKLVEVVPDSRDAVELVPAEQLPDGQWRVLGTPGIVNGCAAGDEVDVAADGTFVVTRRGGNLAIHVYRPDGFPIEALERLRRTLEAHGATVEWPAPRTFVVATAPVQVGFATVERIMNDFAATLDGANWWFGNVYTADDTQLGWWE